jgi:serine/threonine protein kinase
MPTFGQGASSICLPCIEKSTGNQYAVKILTSTYDASNEIETLEKCKSHKNIVKMIEFMKDSLHQYIVLEVLNGEELYDRIKNNGNFDEVSAKHVFKQVTQTVKFLHSHGIVHGDLKPENIILTYNSKESQVKIIDFGFSCQLNSEVQIPRFTLEYAAPESLLPGLINESRDIWSLGVILYIMLCGMSPFRDYDFSFVYQKKEERIIERIREGRFNTLNENWNILSDNAKDLITRMLCVEVKLRPSIDEILFHEWFENTETENESNDHQANDVLDGNVVEECFETLTTEDEGVHSIENTDISCSVEDQKTEKLSCETVDTTTENQAETSSKNVKLMKRRFTTFLGFDQNDNFLNFPNFKNWRDILERESTKEPASSQSSGVDTLYETFEATHSSTVEFVIPSNKNNTISGKALTTSKALITKRKFETQENSNSQSYKRVKYSTREFYENNEAGKYFLRNVTTVEYCMKKPLNSSSNTKAASTIKPLKFNKETAKLRNGKYLRKSKAPINYSDTKKRNMTSK